MHINKIYMFTAAELRTVKRGHGATLTRSAKTVIVTRFARNTRQHFHQKNSCESINSGGKSWDAIAGPKDAIVII